MTTPGQCWGGRGSGLQPAPLRGGGLLSFSSVDWDVAAAQAAIQAERGPYPEFPGPQTEGATLCLMINEASEH